MQLSYYCCCFDDDDDDDDGETSFCQKTHLFDASETILQRLLNFVNSFVRFF